MTATDDGEMYCPSCERSYTGEDTCPTDGTRLIAVTNEDPLLGQDIAGCYTIKSFLGAGGMGTVYVAEQHSVGRDVALKVIGARDGAATKRFLREAKLQSRLTQPHVVTVLDFGKSGPHLFIAMELLEGPTLSEVLKRDGAMSPSSAVDIAVQICEALQAAHTLGIIHRDLKPGNIILTKQPSGDDFVNVLDFGLSKSLTEESQTTVTRSGQILGTPAYMAPETITDGVADVRSDLYSLGVALYAMLAGRRPFQATSPHQLLTMHAQAKPDPLPDTVPAALRAVVMQLLTKDPMGRHESATDVRSALLAAVDGANMAPPRGTRRSVLVAAGLVLAVGASGFLLLRASAGGQQKTSPPAMTAPAAPQPSIVPARADAGATERAPADAHVAKVNYTVRSTPQSLLTVDGRRVGRTPQTLTVRPGTALRVTLTRKGYRTHAESLIVTRTDEVAFTLSRIRRSRPRAKPASSTAPTARPPGRVPWLDHD